MKIPIIVLLLFFSFSSRAQTRELSFDYDASGNQVKRELTCSGCRPGTASKEVADEKKTVTLETNFPDSPDLLSYYPNPVKEHLNLKWGTAKSFVSRIQVYSLNGQLLKNYQVSKTENTKVISFQEFASGIYNIILTYSNGDNKSIKIIKQ